MVIGCVGLAAFSFPMPRVKVNQRLPLASTVNPLGEPVGLVGTPWVINWGLPGLAGSIIPIPFATGSAYQSLPAAETISLGAATPLTFTAGYSVTVDNRHRGSSNSGENPRLFRS